MLIEACVIIGAALIACALKLWDFMVALVEPAHQVRDSPAPSPVVDMRTIASSSPASSSQSINVPSADFNTKKPDASELRLVKDSP